MITIMENTEKKYWNQAITYDAYMHLFKTLVEEEKSTWFEHRDDMVNYTKLNWQRSNRWHKTLELNSQTNTTFTKTIQQEQLWLLITEPWCGDAAHCVPTIVEMAKLNTNIELKIVLRDKSIDLIDKHLSNGGRSIPKLIAMNENFEIFFSWGPRPKEAQELYTALKQKSSDYTELMNEMQKWYNKDKQISIQNELCNLFEKTI